MDLQLAQEKDAILGRDFLTWLWFKSEVQNNIFKTPQGEEFALYLGQKVVVEGGEGESKEKAVCSGMMSRLQEAKQGLRTGKKVVQARLTVEQDSNTWSLQVNSSCLSLSGIKTPGMEVRIQEGEDPDSIFLEKMFLLEKSIYFIEVVYAEFLQLRLSHEWPGEVRVFREWLYRE